MNIFLWFFVISGEQQILKISFLDVGQGDSIFIKAPNGKQMLIDGGPDRGVLTKLGDVIPFYDRSIDVVLATHPDKDHIGGLVNVVQNFDVDYFFNTDFRSDTQVFSALQDLIFEKDVKIITGIAGMRIYLDNKHGVYCDILWPRGNRQLSTESNDTSIIVKLVYGNTSFLLTGDASFDVENELIGGIDPHMLDIDVLKLGHHGSKTSSGENFLIATTPSTAIISAGKENRYGHPSPEVMERIKKFSIPYFATYDIGTILLKSDGETITYKNKHP